MGRKNAAFLIFLVCLIIGCGSLRGKIDKGNRYYNQRNYYAALQQYKSAVQRFPESDIAHYDLGNALYKSGKFAEAAEEYRRALSSENRVLQQKAYYNLGNTYLKLGDLKYAINSYKNALNLNHRDFDAKYNLEFALERLKKLKSQQESQQGQHGQSNQNQLSQSKERPEEASEEPIDRESGKKYEQGKMSKEDVMRMLEALEGDEKNLQMSQLLRRIPKKKTRVDKDW